MTEQATWRAVAAATGPGDRARTEAGIRLAYRRAGLPEPARIVWARSPLEAVRLLSGAPAEDGETLPETGPSVRDAVRNGPIAAERDRLHTGLGPTGWSDHWRATGADLWETTRPLVDRVRTGIVEALAPDDRKEETRIRLLLLDAVLGQHEAAWLTAFDTTPDTPTLDTSTPDTTSDAPAANNADPDPDPEPVLDGLTEVARTAGWWWPYENVAVVSERPTQLHRDEAGRLDRGDGPALAYSDGFALHAWRGLPVPGEFLDRLGALTAEQIRNEENAELRRVMLEYYGYDRYLEESGAKPVHRDETGVLWRIALPGDEDVVMVEVVNSTPEPDGTSRTYWLRVPPTTTTAREGVAWTFGLSAEAYEPLRQT
ncbi:DUF6745 domain-containing protein [Streptomyces ipomoeae]|uniref:DUF6745 domain-containing protein n=1 Tax=Streptomyces ipomoeae 91-03 TaxID=698759 RepID=L1L426_9ACTN|nr:hypothetical protein [Streptomyces ipomoeae]EKX67343.1 hypothetical protein STRIP9103_09047 [Streptomyces ipomoeae 91-03]MDX2693881.1 hypothetical protein [Streptomyces ipomoeae]MDX2838614.1 hypothetical protein [Streptomyces ipomoeae]